ncbi:MAG: helix-turn-helix transcriptional regulator [Crocinitomicaceae bacterium]|nr:helix-turn-helix transcriptional regulator [Crocinitomicaceae bacterium]
MSQQEFSSLFDVKRGTLGSYEEGRAEPKLEFLIKLAEYFKLKIDDIVRSDLTVNKIANFNPPKENTTLPQEISTELEKIHSRIGALELLIKRTRNNE